MYIQSPIVFGSRPAGNTGFARIAGVFGEEFGIEGSLRPWLVSMAITAAAAYLAGYLRSRSTRKAWADVRDVLDKEAGIGSLRNLNGLPQGYSGFAPDDGSDNYLKSDHLNTTGTAAGTPTSQSSQTGGASIKKRSKTSGQKATAPQSKSVQMTVDE